MGEGRASDRASMSQLHFCACLLSVYNIGAKEYGVSVGFITDF